VIYLRPGPVDFLMPEHRFCVGIEQVEIGGLGEGTAITDQRPKLPDGDPGCIPKREAIALDHAAVGHAEYAGSVEPHLAPLEGTAEEYFAVEINGVVNE
jgi:hypothetical protein